MWSHRHDRPTLFDAPSPPIDPAVHGSLQWVCRPELRMKGERSSRSKPGSLAWLMASVFVVALGYGVALPILPFFLERLLDGSAKFSVSWHVGLITGAYAFAIFLFAPLWGRLSDKAGRRSVLLAGLGGFAVFLGAFGLSANLWAAYAARILSGSFAASILPVASAYIVDMGEPELRARRLAWLGASGLGGFLAGPMLAGWITESSGRWLSQFAADVGVPMLSLPFLVAAMVGAAGWGWAYAAIPRVACSTVGRSVVEERGALPMSRSVVVLLLLTFFMMFGLGGFEVGLTLHGRQILGLGPDQISLVFVVCMLVMIAAQGVVFPFFAARWDIRPIAPPAFGLMAVGLALLPGAPDFRALLAAVGFVAVGSGLLAPVMSYRISLVAGDAQGAVLGKQAAASSLGQAVGSIAAGFGFGLINRELFWSTSAVLLISAALSAGLPLPSTRSVAGSRRGP